MEPTRKSNIKNKEPSAGKSAMMRVLEGQLPSTTVGHGTRRFARAYDFAVFLSNPALHGAEWTSIDNQSRIQPGGIIAYGDGQGPHTRHIWMATSRPAANGVYRMVHSTSGRSDQFTSRWGVQQGTCRVGRCPWGRPLAALGEPLCPRHCTAQPMAAGKGRRAEGS
jgi:hypothetical protein